MFRFWKKKRIEEHDSQAAYNSGRQMGAYIAEILEKKVTFEIAQRRERFLMVLDQRLTGIQEIDDVSYEHQARIELMVMLENWEEKRNQQEDELWTAVDSQVAKEAVEILGCKEIGDLIRVLVDRESALLMSEGVGRTAEAIERYKDQKGF